MDDLSDDTHQVDDAPVPDPGMPEVVQRYFAAMRRGAAAEEEMMALFAEHATYREPFSGREPAIGKEAIRERLRLGWEQPLPDLELDVLTVEADDREATATWECRSSVFDGPRRGRDHYVFDGGLIAQLVVTMGDEPTQASDPTA